MLYCHFVPVFLPVSKNDDVCRTFLLNMYNLALGGILQNIFISAVQQWSCLPKTYGSGALERLESPQPQMS